MQIVDLAPLRRNLGTVGLCGTQHRRAQGNEGRGEDHGDVDAGHGRLPSGLCDLVDRCYNA